MKLFHDILGAIGIILFMAVLFALALMFANTAPH